MIQVTGYCISPPQVLGFAPFPEDWAPCIPVGLATECGLVFLSEHENRENPNFHRVQLKSPVEVPPAHWIGIEDDRSATVLRRDDIMEWRVTRATRAIQSLTARPAGVSALRLVSMLHAGAFLLGITVADLHSSLAKVRKSPQEPLEVTVRALAAELARQR